MAEQSTTSVGSGRPAGSLSTEEQKEAARKAPASNREIPGQTMAMSLEEDQPVPPDGSTVMHPPLLLGVVPKGDEEKDESTADDHEKANARTEGKDPDENAIEKITVESGLEEGRVALWERDPAHPNGEAFVGPGHQVEVAKTGAVMARLAAGILKEAGSRKK